MKSSFLLLIVIVLFLNFSYNNGDASSDFQLSSSPDTNNGDASSDFQPYSSPDTLSVSSTLEKICEEVAAVTHNSELTSICLSTFPANAGISTDLKDLALLVTYQIHTNFTYVATKIGELLPKMVKNPSLVGSLETCGFEMKDATDQLEAAYEKIKRGNRFRALYTLHQCFKHFRRCAGLLRGHISQATGLDEVLTEFAVADETSEVLLGLVLLM